MDVASMQSTHHNRLAVEAQLPDLELFCSFLPLRSKTNQVTPTATKTPALKPPTWQARLLVLGRQHQLSLGPLGGTQLSIEITTQHIRRTTPKDLSLHCYGNSVCSAMSLG